MATKKNKGEWREKVRDFFKGTFKAVRLCTAWFKDNIAPELQEFLEMNREAALRIVMAVGKDLAGASDHDKRAEAVRRIDDHVVRELPNLKAPDHWIRLLLELAVAAAKASGKL